MTISEYQKHLDTILQDYEKPYWSPLSNVAHLVEEVGEVARVMNHKYGDKPKKSSESPDDLADELGDLKSLIVSEAINFVAIAILPIASIILPGTFSNMPDSPSNVPFSTMINFTFVLITTITTYAYITLMYVIIVTKLKTPSY